MKIPYNILIQIKMSVRPYFKGFTLIFFFYNCRKQDYSTKHFQMKAFPSGIGSFFHKGQRWISKEIRPFLPVSVSMRKGR